MTVHYYLWNKYTHKFIVHERENVYPLTSIQQESIIKINNYQKERVTPFP